MSQKLVFVAIITAPVLLAIVLPLYSSLANPEMFYVLMLGYSHFLFFLFIYLIVVYLILNVVKKNRTIKND